jgi:hypothetical protein
LTIASYQGVKLGFLNIFLILVENSPHLASYESTPSTAAADIKRKIIQSTEIGNFICDVTKQNLFLFHLTEKAVSIFS